MAERYSRLSEVEKRKKSINLSLFLNKKMNDDRKKSLEKNDNKFSQKISEMEDSLVKRLQMFQDKLRLLRLNPHDHQTEMCAVSTDHHLSPSLIVDPQTEPSTNHLIAQSRDASSSCLSTVNYPSRDVYSTDLSALNCPSNCSILLYNHDNATYTQLSSAFDQRSCNNFQMQTQLSSAFDQRSCNNFQMQTQNPLLNSDQFATWNQIQTPSFGEQFMYPSPSCC
ncbi:unnamed protein product [Microthlaspi erraticum]|nr:unnamed protein product [Microthlaspi erraticum]